MTRLRHMLAVGSVVFSAPALADVSEIRERPDSGTVQLRSGSPPGLGVVNFTPGGLLVTAAPLAAADKAAINRSQSQHADEATAQAQPRRGSGRIELGQSVAGELGVDDETLESGEFTDRWRVTGRRGDRVTVRMTSDQLDSYLVVRGPGGLSEDNDDDGESRGSLNSLVTFTIPADGEILIAATSAQPGERGRYRLSVAATPVGGGSAVPASASSAGRTAQGANAGTIEIGRAATGSLARGDATLESGEYNDEYRLLGRRGQRVELQLSGTGFDPYLFIRGPGGLSEDNDDDPASPDERNSRLVVTLPEDGAYRVVVTSYQPGETGTYQLRVTNPAGPAEQVRTIAAGAPVEGRLAQGDARLPTGRLVDRYSFSGRRGERVVLGVTSSAFDTYLTLVHPAGGQEANDDIDPATNLNSRLEVELPQDGEYIAEVSSYEANAVGAYRLDLARGSSQASTPGLPPVRDARDVAGGARVHVLSVGISDYGGRTTNLDHTAEDALKLSRALQRSGVLNPASVVLTDAGATRAAVRAAFQRIAAQAGPDDIFLFFFSGHGSQIDPITGARELDGRSETIELRDGSMSDQELGQLFRQVRAGRAMIVLDSCFSGGFDNVIDRPGVMGMFSSEEDLTSLVAEKFNAGGYLSHFLLNGLSGAADDDDDRLITAGEITNYVRRQFSRESDLRAETSDGQRSYQNLVVYRGGVRVDDVLLRLPQRISSSSEAPAALSEVAVQLR